MRKNSPQYKQKKDGGTLHDRPFYCFVVGMPVSINFEIIQKNNTVLILIFFRQFAPRVTLSGAKRKVFCVVELWRRAAKAQGASRSGVYEGGPITFLKKATLNKDIERRS